MLHSHLDRFLNILTLCLRNIVTDLLVLCTALLPGVVHSVAALGELRPTLLLILSLLKRVLFNLATSLFSTDLDWFLDVVTLSVLNLLALVLRELLALLAGHLLVLGHRLLAALLHRPLVAPHLLHPLVHSLRHVPALLDGDTVTVRLLGDLGIPLERRFYDLRRPVLCEATDESTQKLPETKLDWGKLLGEADDRY